MKAVKRVQGRGGGRNKNTSKSKASVHPEKAYIIFCLYTPSSPLGGTMI